MEATISHIRRVLFFMGSSAFGVSENGNYVDCSGQMKRAKSRGATDLLYSVTISYKRLISARIRNVGGNGRSIPSEPSMGHHTRQRKLLIADVWLKCWTIATSRSPPRLFVFRFPSPTPMS